MVIVGGCPCCLGQPSWQATFPWEALKLLSGLGVVAGLHVIGVGRGTWALASLFCLALPVSQTSAGSEVSSECPLQVMWM